MSISHDHGGVLIKTVDEDIVGHECIELACEEVSQHEVPAMSRGGKIERLRTSSSQRQTLTCSFYLFLSYSTSSSVSLARVTHKPRFSLP